MKPQAILDLEKAFGITLQELPEGKNIMLSDNRNTFQLNAAKEVIGLNISGNEIQDISPLSQLSALTSLDFSYNQVIDISSLSQLSALTYLDFSYNQVIDISSLSQLSALTSLDFSRNQVIEISSLSQLSALTSLDFWSNEVSDISSLSQLSALTTLKFYNNQVIEISSLSQLSALTSLYFSRNQVIEISSLSQLSALTSLSFSWNQVSDISPLLYLIKEKALPVKWEDREGKSSIYLKNNPLTNPPKEIVLQGNKAILQYFEALAQADKEEFLYEAKLVIVGRGAAGKTTLVKKLMDSTFHLNPNEATTKGIVVLGEPWKLPMSGLQDKDAFTLNIWDFGGQEKYDATHQFFITERTVYLFLTEARKESNYLDYDYWLRTIELLSKNSPVIVVQTKTDDRDKAMPEEIYKNQFKNIEAFVKISCADGWEHTLENLKGYLRTAVSKLRQNKERLSNRWVDVREYLQILSKEKDCISYEEYIKICTQHKIPQSQADVLSGFLHDLGIIIHHQKDILLKNTVVINPEWGVDGVYKVIDDKLTIDNNGLFSEEDLQRIWNEAKYQNKQSELLRLMQKFELCFEIEKQHYIAPELLSLNTPKALDKAWETQPILPYRYTYNFMPAGIMGRLIVKCHDNLYQKQYWKTGAVFCYQKAKAKVEEFYFDKRLHISLQGDAEDCKELLAILRNHIDAIHQSFDKLPVQELLPCCCSVCKVSAKPYFHLLEVVRKAEMNPQAQGKLQCQKSFVSVLIRDIKQAVYNPKSIKAEENLRSYIAKNELDKALDVFEDDTDASILLRRELRECEENYAKGILKQEDYSRQKADIGNRILHLEKEEHNPVKQQYQAKNPTTSENTNKEETPLYKKWWAILIGVLSFAAILFGSLNDGLSVFDRFFSKTKTNTAEKAKQPIQTIQKTRNNRAHALSSWANSID